MTKGLNIVTEFNESKGTLFNKKVISHKMKRIQSKKQKVEYTKSAKYYYRILMIKDLF